ncbi:MAG: hypothetical protein C4523_11710, partial [Myxococcales bacterium]
MSGKRISAGFAWVAALGVLGFCGFFGFSCDDQGDVADIAAGLEDQLVDALRFERGAKRQGSPPEGRVENAPQVEVLRGEQEHRPGEDFAFELESVYAQAGDVTRAVVAVEGATQHIVVEGALTARVMALVGTLADDPDLYGKSFTISFALQTADGRTGLYKSMRFVVLGDKAPELDDPVEDTAFAESRYEPSGRPE